MANSNNTIRTSLFVASLVLSTFGANAIASPQQQPADPPSSTAPDNSAQNKAPGSSADDQSNKPADVEITKKIRQAILEDKSLSTYAQNVKVIVKDGAVILKGPVRSEEEKKKVADIAAQVAGGPDKVSDELTVQNS